MQVLQCQWQGKTVVKILLLKSPGLLPRGWRNGEQSVPQRTAKRDHGVPGNLSWHAKKLKLLQSVLFLMKSEAQQECWHSQFQPPSSMYHYNLLPNSGFISTTEPGACICIPSVTLHPRGEGSRFAKWSRLIIIHRKRLKSDSHMSPGKDNSGDVNGGGGGRNHFGENFPKFSAVLVMCFPLVSHRDPRQQKQF